MQTILAVDDPSKEFTLDPNGFVQAVTRTMTDAQKAKAKAEALAEMRKMQVRDSKALESSVCSLIIVKQRLECAPARACVMGSAVISVAGGSR